MQHPDRFDFDRSCDPPMELVPVERQSGDPLPRSVRHRVAVYAPHDGACIPREYRYREDGSPLVDLAELERQFVQMRDWGANVVAEQLASELGLETYATVRVARVLLDFNRFPGSTPSGVSEPLDALAIGRLYGAALDHRQKAQLLEAFYDRISRTIEKVVEDSLIGLAIHTYDEAHESNTKRAAVSLISLPLSYQREARLPYNVFDPMYPDHLAESTCSRILRDRMSLNLERSGFRVTHNHPYALPDGSIEVRAQVWHFFRFLQRHFEAAHPDCAEDPAYQRVWTTLQDTNLRLAEAEALRSFLHRFRRIEEYQRKEMLAALAAYQHVHRYVKESTVVVDYRRSPERPSSIGIEVRKDLVMTIDPETGRPRPPTEEQREVVVRIAKAIAGSVRTYFDTDRQVYEMSSKEISLDDI